MIFNTLGNPSDPAILFFHAMGVTGESSTPVANFLQDRYFCIMPTSTVYCAGQKYISKADELHQIEIFLEQHAIKRLELVVASSMGADLAAAFLSQQTVPAGHVFFDGGQFAQIPALLRHITVPVLYLAMKSLYFSGGKTLKHILWCDDEAIRPYFIKAGKNVTYRNLRRQLSDSLKNEPFPPFPQNLQKHTFWEFGSAEDHFKYRPNVVKSYPYGNFPVFEGLNHMQYQIRSPEGFAAMLDSVMKQNQLPPLEFLQQPETGQTG